MIKTEATQIRSEMQNELQSLNIGLNMNQIKSVTKHLCKKLQAATHDGVYQYVINNIEN